MSVKEQKLIEIDQKVLQFKLEEKKTKLGLGFYWAKLRTYLFILYYEIVKNDIAIRAESLSYFTLFSMMPLIAGIFLILNAISQWAPVQNEFESLIGNFLQAIPTDQRETLMEFILQFKDQYLATLSHQSGSIGIFALGVLVWIAGKVFFNLESLMNRIWEVKMDRPFFERIQNFVFCIVLFPLAYIAALSIPGMIEHFGQKSVGVILRHGIPTFIAFFSLTFLFKYFPNTKVAWKSAVTGATLSTMCFGASNFFLRIYFHFGTSTAYGKAAILPIFAFFVYVAWIIFILGVEVSLLCQSEEKYSAVRYPQTTLAQALILEKTIGVLSEKFRSGLGAMSSRELSKELCVSFVDLDCVLSFLHKKKIIIAVEREADRGTAVFSIARSVDDQVLLGIIKDFLNLSKISQNLDVFQLLSRLKS